MAQVLIVGQDNAVRSQMLEGYLKKKLGPRARVYSCGIEPSGVDPQAIRAMAEDQVVIAGQTSDWLKDYQNFPFDQILVFEAVPVSDISALFPNANSVPIPIPPIEGFGGKERLERIRHLRLEIEAKSNELIASLFS